MAPDEKLHAIRESEQLATVTKASVDQPRWGAVLWILHSLLDIVSDLHDAVSALGDRPRRDPTADR